jgi:ABC-type dipeptide/oligopeptide/nickel transport system permease subunit
MIDLQHNWAGNQAFQAQRVHHPRTVDELRELVARCEHLKPIGARHSFTTIADTSGDMISMEHFNQMLAVDEGRQTVTVQAGMPYGLFCSALHQAGFGIHNMASLPQITVGGACATATHGSGDGNGNLATAVTGLKLVTADGEIVEIVGMVALFGFLNRLNVLGLETLGEDFTRAARSRGLPEHRVFLVHGLKNASLPLVTLIGLQLGFLMAGAVVVEAIFNWPGIGKLILDSLASRDFPMIQGGILVAAVVFVVLNFVVDLLYALLDPRVRAGQT